MKTEFIEILDEASGEVYFYEVEPESNASEMVRQMITDEMIIDVQNII